jgi:hypothetical protein
VLEKFLNNHDDMHDFNITANKDRETALQEERARSLHVASMAAGEDIGEVKLTFKNLCGWVKRFLTRCPWWAQSRRLLKPDWAPLRMPQGCSDFAGEAVDELRVWVDLHWLALVSI